MKRTSSSLVEIGQGETIAYAATLDKLRRHVPFAFATIATTLPRGGLQVIQPRHVNTAMMRLYTRQMHAWDVAAWRAMASGRIQVLDDLIGDDGRADRQPGGRDVREVAAAFRDGFVHAIGMGGYMAVPLKAPLLRGFPGVLQVFRGPDADVFGEADLRRMAALAQEFDAAHAQAREHDRFKVDTHPLRHHIEHRQFAILRGPQAAFPDDGLSVLDATLASNLLATVQDRLGRLDEILDVSLNGLTTRPRGGASGGEGFNGDVPYEVDPHVNGAGDADPAGIADPSSVLEPDPSLRPAAAGSNADRLLVPDRFGDFWAFRLALFPRYPAITGRLGDDEPVGFASHQPDCESWSSLRPSDFAADDEIGRLIPALQFMQEHFATSISLQKVARTVHLSPFHFHRRFTDLLGITPKHYLFDCQIAQSKRLLASGRLELRDIAVACGFAHQSHFTSRFKQATGLTPTQWRRVARNHSSTHASGHASKHASKQASKHASGTDV